jgi:hypothetical protein
MSTDVLEEIVAAVFRAEDPGGWLDGRAGLDDFGERKCVILPGLELLTLGRLYPTSQGYPCA